MAEDKIQYSIGMEIPYFQVPNDIFDIDIEVIEQIKEKGSDEFKIIKRAIKSHEKLAYIYLCRCGNNGRQAFPSYNKIAEKCGISRRSAINTVKVLEDSKLIIKSSRKKINSTEQDSNKYLVAEPKNIYLSSAGDAPPSAGDAPHLVQEIHHPSAPGAPKKEQLKKNNIKKNNITTASDNYDWKSINKEYFNTYKQLISGTVVNLIQSYLDDGMEEAVIIHALRLSTKAKNFNYTKAILNDWLEKGFKTMEDVKKLEGLNKPLAATIDAISKVNLGG